VLSRKFAGGLISRPVKRWASTAATAGLTVSLLGTVVAITPAQAQAATSTPVASRSDAVSAMMAAKKQGSRVEVLDDRTDSSQTFANADGTFSYQAYAVPQWIEQGGSWKSLDPTLTTTASGSIVPTLSQSPLVLSSGGSGPLATMTVDGKQFSVTWPTALPKPTLSGATATYDNVLPSGVNLQVTATAAGGVEETLIVENATAAADPALASLVQATSGSTGTTVSADAGGNLTVTDASGNTLVTSPAPVMWDSSTSASTSTTPDSPSPAAPPSASAMTGGANAAGADKVKVTSLDETPATRSGVGGPGSRAHQGRVKVTYSKHKLDLAPDHGLLTAKSTTFPVYIDPAYVPHPASGTTLAWDEVQSAYPTTSEYNAAPGSGLGVGFQGFSSPTGIERSYYALSIPSAIYGSTILSASLNTTVTYAAASGSNSDTVDAYSTSAISSTTTWNTQPGHEAGANANYPNPDATATFTTTSQSPNKAVAFNLLTSMQLIATAHNYKTWDFELANSTETNDVDLLRFADNPTFSITYNNPPATPASLSMTPSNTVGSTAYSSTGTPTLSSSATDANGDTVQLDYQVLSGTTVKASGTSTGFVNSGTPATWKPATALANGAYTWQVRAYDGQAYSAWTTAKAFTVDTTVPPAPTVTCAGYPHGVWTPAISGGTTCTLSDTSSDVLGYSWGVDVGSGSTTWTTGTSITINPAPGYHTLSVFASSNSLVPSTVTSYVFGVGSAGITSPADQSTTSTTLPLSATAPSGATKVTFKYRVGTTGSFTSIPTAAVTNNGAAVTWPLATTAGTGVVTTPSLTWNLAQTVSDDGLLQVEAEFSAANGNLIDSPPVNVTLDRLGTGTDFGTTTAGPVTVGLQSGNAALSQSDVSIKSFGADLTVDRTFNSLAPGVASIFGPGWTMSIASNAATSWNSIIDDGSYAVLTGADSTSYTFSAGATTGGVTSYTGDGAAVTGGLSLSKNGSSNTFTLEDTSNDTTVFTASASDDDRYQPSTVAVPGTSSTAGYVYNALGAPLLVVAPAAATNSPATNVCPSPASASTWNTPGCRGLAFAYNSSGDVTQITFDYTDNGGTFHSTAVADYSYDSSGRLVSEWDPRLATPLVTTYTYDETSGDADNGRLVTVSPAQASGSGALAPWTLTYDDTSGSSDFGKLVKVARTHNTANGAASAVTTIDYETALTIATGGPIDIDPATAATWAQGDVPASAVAVWSPTHVPASTPSAADYQYAQIDYYDAEGREVDTAQYVNGSWAVATTQYDTYGNVVRELTAANRAAALASASPAATAQALETFDLYGCDNFGTVGACTSADQSDAVVTDTYGPAHSVDVDGILESARTHTAFGYDAGAPSGDTNSSGNPYMLQTSKTVSASVGTSIPGSSTVDPRTTQYLFSDSVNANLGWTLGAPLQVVTDPGALAITSTTVYNQSSSLYGGDNLETDVYQPATTSGGTAADTQMVYYTAGANSQNAACGNRPEWADLLCTSGPAAQPTDTSSIPTTTYTYNDYLDNLATTKTYGTTGTETVTLAYDAADRPLTTTTTVSGTGMGAAVPQTKELYSTTTGVNTGTETLDASGDVATTTARTYDDFGNSLTYTDATGNVASYTYDIADRPVSLNDGNGTDTYTYSPGSQIVSENDSEAGTFTATYDPDGTLLTEKYPDGTVGTYTVDATGTATAVTYANNNWTAPLTDSITANAQGDWTSESSPGAQKTYAYDSDDRLTGVTDTATGSCVARGYTYDSDSNRTSQTIYDADSTGDCQTATAASTEHYTFDAADRLDSSAANGTTGTYGYDTQGDVTDTPSVDAGGSGDLTATYFANGQLQSQTKNASTTTWTLDPDQDRYATWTDGTGTTYTNHYADDSDNTTWTQYGAGSWTRNVQGPDGNLTAEVTTGGVVSFELTDLHGDVMATVDPTSDVGPSATYAYTEFGQSEGATPTSAYGYLGGDDRSSAALGGTILMGARVYSPENGRFDEVDPVAGGSANAYDYVAQNPITQVDLCGQSFFGNLWHITKCAAAVASVIATFYFPWAKLVKLKDEIKALGGVYDAAKLFVQTTSWVTLKKLLVKRGMTMVFQILGISVVESECHF
jgi:RHS repeat-associated protein